MAWDIENNWPDMAELRVDEATTPSALSDDTELRIELYTGDQTFDYEEFRAIIGFHRITLEIACDGTEIAVGERYGDIRPNDSTTDITVQSEASASAGGGAELSLSGGTLPNAQVSLSAKASKSTLVKSETSTTTIDKNVIARPNNKWEITSLDKSKYLSAKYISADTRLCLIRPKLNANRNGIRVYLYGYKRDIVFKFEEDNRSIFKINNNINSNKKRVLETLFSKEISEKSDKIDKNNTISLSLIKNISYDD
ncbi:hypothetical protein ACLBWS_17725 [Brucellaceae bacterium D45D]